MRFSSNGNHTKTDWGVHAAQERITYVTTDQQKAAIFRSVTVLGAVLLIAAATWLFAADSDARERCLQGTQSADVCNYTLR